MTNFGVEPFLEKFVDLAPPPRRRATSSGLQEADDPQFSAFCLGWPLCAPSEPLGYLKLAHLALVGVAMLLMVWLLRKAWREQRDQNVLLPLTTVTGVLFFGQALIGAVEVTRSYPVHLVVLHALTAVALWISLGSLVYLSGVLAVDTNVVVKFDYRQRAKDFFILSKPIIVLLLLVTTYSGLVAGSQAWPSASLTFWTLLGGTLAAAGSSALNQYIDRELDKNMQRTAKRPLADGRLTAAEGLSYGLALCLTSYYVMAGFVNLLAALLSLTGIFYYVCFASSLSDSSWCQGKMKEREKIEKRTKEYFLKD